MNQNTQNTFDFLSGTQNPPPSNPQPYLNNSLPQQTIASNSLPVQQYGNSNSIQQQISFSLPPPLFGQVQQQSSFNGYNNYSLNKYSKSNKFNILNNPAPQQQLNNNMFDMNYQQIPQFSEQPVMFAGSLGHNSNGKGLTLLNKQQDDKNKEVVAVIVTLHAHGSYDHLFTSVQQKSQQGTKVLVYQADSNYIQPLIKAFEGQPTDEVSTQMMENIKKIHPDCVVFNWQCCGFYGGQNFPEGKAKVFKFLKTILDKGHMAMFSDFSLKALIHDWDQTLIGPNPFVKTSQTSGNFELRFKPGQLKQCPSAQLQIVGQMAESGVCNVAALGGTICYSINKQKLNHESYKLQVLSISVSTPPAEKKYQLTIGQHKGSAGHVLLTFPSGGLILTSMGHWIQLMKIDTSEKKLFEIAQKQYGQQYAQKMQMQYANLNVNQQKAWISSNAVNFVQNQAPCTNMSKKSKNFY